MSIVLTQSTPDCRTEQGNTWGRPIPTFISTLFPGSGSIEWKKNKKEQHRNTIDKIDLKMFLKILAKAHTAK